MKKKVLAFLLASTMVVEPFNVASAADFSDGTGQDVVQFSDEEDVPEVENDGDVDQFSTDAAGEGENSSKPSEDAIQMGDDVWMTYDDSTRTATISGTGDMWDYLQDGATLDGAENPLINQGMNTLIIGDGITHVSDYLLYKEEGNLVYGHGVQNIQIGKNVRSIGKYAFHFEASLNEVKFMGNDIQELGENCFRMCRGMNSIILPDSINKLGDGCFAECTGLKSIKLPNSLQEIPDSCFYRCESLQEINIPDNVLNISYAAFQNCSGLKKITFSMNSKIKKIGGYVWDSCVRLEEVNLPDSLSEIGYDAFSNCSSLQKVNLSHYLKLIGSNAFYKCVRLEAINLPDSLTQIGYDAFGNCSKLNNVVVPKGIKTLENSVFSNCSSLSNIVLNEGLECIGAGAFGNCIRLQMISIPQSVTNIRYGYDEEERTYYSPFAGCDNLTNIEGYTCSAAKKFYDWFLEKTGKKITFTSKGEGTHQWSAEKEVIKEPTCTEKGIKAFKCEICGTMDESSKEEIPAYDHNWDNGVVTKQATETEEGEIKYTCWRCNETKIEKIPKLAAINFQVNKNNQRWYSHYQYGFWCTSNKDVTYYVECVKKDSEPPTYDSSRKDGEIEANGGSWIYADVTDEDAVDIYVFATNTNGDYICVKVTPNNSSRPEKPVYKVGKNVTASIEGDTLILTGSGETYDESWWFDEINSNNIKHIIVKDGVTSLGSSIFYGFRKLEDVQLPSSLKNIGRSAFEKCDSLKELTIPEGVTNIGNGIINSCTSMKKISLPSTLNTIPRLIDMESTGDMQLNEIVLNKGIETIGNNAFWNLKNIKNITIPDSVTTIGDYAFSECTALTNLILPDSIVKIGGGAFSDCVALDKITLPSNLTSLDYDAFEYCNVEVIFPSSLKCIPELGNNAVKKVKIPEGVETIGEDAFFGCSNLTEITLPSTITSIESNAFLGTGITSFNYPQNITNIPNGVFKNTNLTEFSVPEKVTEIDDNAFCNCYDLTKISIPKSVTYIGTDAFKDCRNLTIYGYKDSAAESYAKANNIKFVSADYKVIFKDNGRTQKTEYIKSGENATPPSLTKAGYTLSWDADYTNITEDMVINAVWTKKDSGSSGGGTTIIVTPSESTKYTVTFKDRGKIVKTEKVKSGDAAEYPFISRNGYELSWDKDFSKITADTTVNAVWTVIKPAKVTSLTAEAGKKSIALSWDETEYTSYYLVYRKADAETEYTQVAKTTKVLWTDSKAVPGTQYSYKVVAVRSLEGKKYQGADSDVVTTKIGTPQIGDIYSVGSLNYKIISAKEVSVTGLAKATDTLVIPPSVTISGKVYKVTSIQEKAFYRNEDIVSVTIGNNVTEVGKYAFYQCSGLENVKFGKRVAIINTCAFTQCKNLENVTLPSSIRRIGAKAFYQCTSIKVLKINGSNLEYVGKKGLAVNKSVTLKLPKKSYTMYKNLIKASSIYGKTKFSKF